MAGYLASELIAQAARLERLEEEARARELDPDLAGPIASTSAEKSVFAALIDGRKTGALTFVDDVALQIFPERERELRLDGELLGSTSRFELKSEDRRTKNLTAIRATHPYGVDWLAEGKFKPPRPHRGAKAIEDELRDLLNGAEDIWRAVEALPFDYFETRKIWTAVLKEPRRIAVAATAGRAFNKKSAIRLPGKNPKFREVGLEWLFGLCENPAAAIDRLKEETRFLLDHTHDGTLFTRHRGGALFLRDFTLSEAFLAHAEDTWEGSLWSALAGPREPIRELPPEQRSVAKLAQEIYLRRAHAAAKRDPHTAPAITFDEMIEHIEDELEETGNSDRALANARALLESQNAEERIIALATLTALRAQLTPEDHQAIRDLKKSDPEKKVRESAAAALSER